MPLYPNFFLLYEGQIGGSEKCHCKRGASYFATVTDVTVIVSGESCSIMMISIYVSALAWA